VGWVKADRKLEEVGRKKEELWLKFDDDKARHSLVRCSGQHCSTASHSSHTTRSASQYESAAMSLEDLPL
jgi:hypothetical protein